MIRELQEIINFLLKRCEEYQQTIQKQADEIKKLNEPKPDVASQ
jgi:prefoldin subunit 5